MYCFRIENAYTQSGLIANPTELCNIKNRLMKTAHRSVISFGCYTDIRFVEIRNSAAELSIECENLKIKGERFLTYVKKTEFWRNVCVHNT